MRITAYAYAFYCLAMVPVFTLSRSESAGPDEKIATFVFFALCAVAALSATRRRRIGYYFCFVLSVLLLPGVGVGTIVGWNMLRALRANRHQFRRRRAPSIGTRD